MKPLFVDTAGWVALLDERDELHRATRRARDAHLKRGGRLVTTDYVNDETLTLRRMKAGLKVARRYWWMISESGRIRVESVSPDRTRRAREWFFSWDDKDFSFTDCTSFVVMKELGLTRVLTTDRHFRQAGFTMIPR